MAPCIKERLIVVLVGHIKGAAIDFSVDLFAQDALQLALKAELFFQLFLKRAMMSAEGPMESR